VEPSLEDAFISLIGRAGSDYSIGIKLEGEKGKREKGEKGYAS
jgi:hypothetical protein